MATISINYSTLTKKIVYDAVAKFGRSNNFEDLSKIMENPQNDLGFLATMINTMIAKDISSFAANHPKKARRVLRGLVTLSNQGSAAKKEIHPIIRRGKRNLPKRVSQQQSLAKGDVKNQIKLALRQVSKEGHTQMDVANAMIDFAEILNDNRPLTRQANETIRGWVFSPSVSLETVVENVYNLAMNAKKVLS